MIGEHKILKQTERGPLLISPGDWDICSRYTWAIRRKSQHATYAATSFLVNGRRFEISIHRFLMNPDLDFEVDHINNNGLDNRRENLRICTRLENARNVRKLRGDRTSVFKGVWRCPRSGAWRARYTRDRQQFVLGVFSSEIEAAQAYDNHVRALGNPFDRFNFPKEGEFSAVGKVYG